MENKTNLKMTWEALLADNQRSTKTDRQQRQVQHAIRFLATSAEEPTVEQVCKHLKISTPTGLKLMNELLDNGLIKIVGKKETENGRKPALYALNHNHFYALSVEVLLKRVTVAVVDLSLNSRICLQDKDFRLDNTQASLDRVVELIDQSLQQMDVPHEALWGIGIGITGRVNIHTGESHNYFNFMPQSLGSYLAERFQLPVVIDNDTHTFGLAEKSIGRAQNISNALVVNLSRGLGATLILNGEVVNGTQGFAGEFGHMQFGNSDRPCICGKVGCLGTIVSGYGLEEEFKARIAAGEHSQAHIGKQADDIRYDDILAAAQRGDALSIQLTQELGTNLGKALGNIINLLNPEKVILSGKFAALGDFFSNTVRSGMITTGLPNPLQHCTLETSELGDLAGLRGAGALVFRHHELL